MRAVLRLLPVIATRPRLFVEAAVWSTLSQAAVLAVALGLAAVVGRVMARAPVDEGPVAALLATGCLVAALAAWRESWVSHDLAYGLIAVLRGHVYDALRRALPSRRDRHRSGDLLTTAVADIETLEWLYAHTVAQMLGAAAVLTVSASVSVSISPMLLLVWVPLLVASVVVPLMTGRVAARHAARLAGDAARLRAETLDTLRGLRELRGADALGDQLGRLAAQARRVARTQVRDAVRLGAERGIADALFALAALGVLFLSLDRAVDPEDLPLAVTVAVAGLAPASQIADLLRSAGTLRESAARIVTALELPPAVEEVSTPPARVPGEAGLVFDRVGLAHDDRVVLDALDLHVHPGEIVALVGPSGVGKTTAARLALRMWDPDAGAVRVDGIDLRALPDDELRRLVSVVPQSSPVLRGTVRSNILLGDPDAPPHAVERAAAASGLLDPASGLQRGLDTPIGEHGGGLSGGQRARVAIARALLRDPRVLILDEATASLDPDADAAVLDLLRRTQDRAVLLIAHRPATIAAADRRVTLAARGG